MMQKSDKHNPSHVKPNRLPVELLLPENIQYSASLTEYAVTTRYPSVLEPVDEEEYQEAVQLAKIVLSWAEHVIQQSQMDE